MTAKRGRTRMTTARSVDFYAGSPTAYQADAKAGGGKERLRGLNRGSRTTPRLYSQHHPPQTAPHQLFVTVFEPAQDLHIAVLVPARGKEQKWALIKNPRQTITNPSLRNERTTFS
jgi:hypothetical protein